MSARVEGDCGRKTKARNRSSELIATMRLESLYVLCLEALGALHDVELHSLAFLKALESVGLDGREVNEYVFAILTADESKSLCIVKPLYCSLFHFSVTCF